LSKSYISELERGARTPRLTTIKILARRLNRPLSHFLEGVPADHEAQAYLAIGLASLHAEAFGEAAQALERALDLAAQEGDDVLTARIELALAVADRHRGEMARARQRIDRAVRVLGRTGDEELLANAQVSLGRIKLEGGEPEAALWAFEAALRLARQRGPDPSLLAELHLYLGVAQRRLGNTEESQDALERALEVEEPFHDQHRTRSRPTIFLRPAGTPRSCWRRRKGESALHGMLPRSCVWLRCRGSPQ
jgi:tetratricopeptide (TPR) repeat protein